MRKKYNNELIEKNLIKALEIKKFINLSTRIGCGLFIVLWFIALYIILETK